MSENPSVDAQTDPVLFKSYKIRHINAYEISSNKPKAAFRCGSCTPLLLGRRKSEEKNLKHFKYCHNQGWITAGAALAGKKTKEKGLKNITIGLNCCYVWPTGPNQITEEDYPGSSSPEVMHPGPESQSLTVSKLKELKIVTNIWILGIYG